MTAVRCDGLELRAGYKSLIKNFSFEIEFASSVVVTGPNGLGKTTLLRTICGVSKPHAGTVTVNGKSVWPFAGNHTQDASFFYLASQPALFADHSVIGNLEFYMRCIGAEWNTETALQALAVVGLSARKNQTVRTLSTGQKRRLSLAFLHLARPKIVLLDEPTNGLDAEGVELCLGILGDLKKTGRSAIMIATHDPALVAWADAKLELQKWQP